MGLWGILIKILNCHNWFLSIQKELYFSFLCPSYDLLLLKFIGMSEHPFIHLISWCHDHDCWWRLKRRSSCEMRALLDTFNTFLDISPFIQETDWWEVPASTTTYHGRSMLNLITTTKRTTKTPDIPSSTVHQHLSLTYSIPFKISSLKFVVWNIHGIGQNTQGSGRQVSSSETGLTQRLETRCYHVA